LGIVDVVQELILESQVASMFHSSLAVGLPTLLLVWEDIVDDICRVGSPTAKLLWNIEATCDSKISSCTTSTIPKSQVSALGHYPSCIEWHPIAVNKNLEFRSGNRTSHVILKLNIWTQQSNL
jgi:hypothetical protein